MKNMEAKQEDEFSNTLTIGKMRDLIMQTEMCRKDKNCGACRRVNFCAIWNNRWNDMAIKRINGTKLEAYSEKPVKDLNFLVLYKIEDAVSKTFDALITYMQAKNLLFNDEYSGFVKKIEDKDE
jgi:hypothetical protein